MITKIKFKYIGLTILVLLSVIFVLISTEKIGLSDVYQNPLIDSIEQVGEEQTGPDRIQYSNWDSVFTTNYYQLIPDRKHGIIIRSIDGGEILSGLGYFAEYGKVYNSLEPALEKNEDTIYLDKQPPYLQPGDKIEIRAESYIGRMNTPLIHRAAVTHIEDNVLRFQPTIKRKLDYGVHIKQIEQQINSFTSAQMEYEENETKLKLKLTGKTEAATVEIIFSFAQDSPVIDIDITTTYNKDVHVFEESLILNFEPEVTQIYRKNRQVDTGPFQEEYWLDRQGVQFGKDNVSALVYHTPEISSLSLRTRQKQLLVHLDHESDHRYLQSVETRATGFIRHAAEYNTEEQRHNQLSIMVGHLPNALPRLMLQPNGYLATHIWTEHADEGIMASHRAVYFGSEDISNAEKAIGGFVKHGIPVTKSVFYSNQGYPRNSPIDVSIKEEPLFLDFLRQIYALGSEITFHSIQPRDNPSKELSQEALQFMQDNFDTKTWIDHGHIDTTFAFQALDKYSSCYMGDLWRKYGIKYFWHYSCEDITGTEQGRLNLLQTNNGDAARTPLYWQHPTVTEDFYSFAAAVVIDDNFYVYSRANLKELVDDWGVFINHTYPVRFLKNQTSTKYYTTDKQGKLIVNPKFDQLLQYMTVLQQDGKLYLTTIDQILEYWISLNNISYAYEMDGSVTLTNHNDQPIHGLSLAIQAPKAYVNGEIPQQKKINKDTVFWFDLPAYADVNITID